MAAFLDTNVFLYAAGGEHPLRTPCQNILRRVASGQLAATTSSEVVQEILYVLARRDLVSEALTLARSVLQLCPALLEVGAREMAAACDLLAAHPELPPRDAVHAATMASHGLTTIISAAPHFDQLQPLHRLSPDRA